MDLKVCSTKEPQLSVWATNTLQSRLSSESPSDYIACRVIASQEKIWRGQSVLAVEFLDGDKSTWDKVEEQAHVWSQYANIRFDFKNLTNSDIRISFLQEGSWSYVGTDAQMIHDKKKPTMNLGWLEPQTSDMEYRRVVLHEFGHALGLLHEHKHPKHGIEWNKGAVYAYYMGFPNHWSKKEVDVQIFEKDQGLQIYSTRFDPNSIMIYAIPKVFTKNGMEIEWNHELSELDKRIIAMLYPF